MRQHLPTTTQTGRQAGRQSMLPISSVRSTGLLKCEKLHAADAPFPSTHPLQAQATPPPPLPCAAPHRDVLPLQPVVGVALAQLGDVSARVDVLQHATLVHHGQRRHLTRHMQQHAAGVCEPASIALAVVLCRFHTRWPQLAKPDIMASCEQAKNTRGTRKASKQAGD
jgi:hypothetical protein